MVLVSTNFPDVLDIRFEKIFFEEYPQLESMLGELYTFVPTNGRADLRWSQEGTLPNFTEFSGTVTYQDFSEGYDTVNTPLEFANGFQIERKLFDDDQHNIMNNRAAGLATAAARTREEDGSRVWNNANAVDSRFYVNSESVALVSDSHTNTSGASMANGFDNKTTSALTATAVATMRIQSRGFRGDQAERFSVKMDEIWIPPDLYEPAFEIVSSMGKVDTANNNRNVHQGVYTIKEWDYMTDSNNFFMADSRLRTKMLHWTDRVPLEFGMTEDADTFIGKWRAYMRYGTDHSDWRWTLGAIVS